MKKKYRVNLTDKERAYAHNILEGEKTSAGYRKRANILIMLDEGICKPETHGQIAARCDVSPVTVCQTAKDYCEKGIEYTLNFQTPKNPPRRPIVDKEAEGQILALVCSDPPEGYSQWTIRLLTEKVVEYSILQSASRETIRRTLNKLNIDPTYYI